MFLRFLFTIILLCPLNIYSFQRDVFADTLKGWLSSVGFQGEVTALERSYDSDEMLEQLYLGILDDVPKMGTTELIADIGNENGLGYLSVEMPNKDFSHIPFLTNWMVKAALHIVTHKLSSLLGLEKNTEKVGNGYKRIRLTVSDRIPQTRYQFSFIDLYYKAEDKKLSLMLQAVFPQDGPLYQFLISEVNNIAYSLERGEFPNFSFFASNSESQKSTLSDHLLLVLQETVQGSGHPPLKFQGNLELESALYGPEF